MLSGASSYRLHWWLLLASATHLTLAPTTESNHKEKGEGREDAIGRRGDAALPWNDRIFLSLWLVPLLLPLQLVLSLWVAWVWDG